MPPKKNKQPIPEKSQTTLERFFSPKGKEPQKCQKQETQQRAEEKVEKKQNKKQQPEKKKKGGKKRVQSKDRRSKEDSSDSASDEAQLEINQQTPSPIQKKRKKGGKGKHSLSKEKIERKSLSKGKEQKSEKQSKKSKSSKQKSKSSIQEEKPLSKQVAVEPIMQEAQIEKKEPQIVKFKAKKGGKSKSKPKLEKCQQRMDVETEQNKPVQSQKEEKQMNETDKKMDVQEPVAENQKNEKKQVVRRKKGSKFTMRKNAKKTQQQTQKPDEMEMEAQPAPILWKMNDPKYAFLMAQQEPLSDTQYIFDKTRPQTLNLNKRNPEDNPAQAIKPSNEKPKLSQGKPPKKRPGKESKSVDKDKQLKQKAGKNE